jgi:hypothetical protein
VQTQRVYDVYESSRLIESSESTNLDIDTDSEVIKIALEIASDHFGEDVRGFIGL